MCPRCKLEKSLDKVQERYQICISNEAARTAVLLLAIL